MNGPSHTKYYKLGLETLGKPRIACTRLEAAGRRIAQQFFVQNAIDKAVLQSSPAQLFSHKLPTKKPELDYLSSILPYSGPNIENLVHQAESHPLTNVSREEMVALLSNPRKLVNNIAKTANKSQLWASDWIKIITKLLSTQKITQAQLIIDSLIATGEKLPLGILANALEVARIRGHQDQFTYYASACPLPRIPIPYPPTQLQLVVSKVRYHRQPQYSGDHPLNAQFFQGNYSQDPTFPELLKALAKGYHKYHDPEMLDSVVWWANDTGTLNYQIAHVNLAAARQWNDPQRAWWTWQQVKERGLDNIYLREVAADFECLRKEVSGNAHTPGMMLLEGRRAATSKRA